MKALTIVFLITLTSFLQGQEITSYDLDVKIDANGKTVSVEGLVDIDFKGKDSINLVLWKNTDIREISCCGEDLKYFFDTLSPTPVMYIINGSSLIIKKPMQNEEKQSIKFIYECNMKEFKSWSASFEENWIEINVYCGWFPVSFESKSYLSKFKIYIDEDYIVTGSGLVEKKNDYWEMIQPWPAYDNVIIASKKLKSKILNENIAFIQTDYNDIDFSDSDADSILSECKYVFNLFERFFGKKDSTYIKFVIAPFEWGGGYSRKNFISMRTKHFNLYTSTKGIAHEIAHFWWNKAVTTMWEDWLNEAFAEYSMLLYSRERLGLEEFQKQVEEYKSKIKNLPSVWGIERESQEAYSVLYEKGSLILYEMEEKVGKSSFLNFLKEVSDNNIATTEDLLNLVENKLSQETRVWLENKLKVY
jgi:aminopeptidase N